MTLQELYDGLIGDLGQGTVDAEGRERIWEAMKAAEALGMNNAPVYCAPAGTFDNLTAGGTPAPCAHRWVTTSAGSFCDRCGAED